MTRRTNNGAMDTLHNRGQWRDRSLEVSCVCAHGGRR